MTAQTIATVRTLPAIRLLTARRLPLESREALLAWVATEHLSLNLPGEAVDVLVAAWSHDSVTGPALEAAWEGYLRTREIEQDAVEGRLHWSVIDDELTCADRTAVAAEIAHQDAEAALHVLARGSGTTTNGGTR